MKDLIDTVEGNPQFSTLASAIKTANLTDILSRTEPYTIFAPTNEAFKKVPPETLTEVLGDPERLSSILNYHVVAGKVMSADVMRLKEAVTVEGMMVTIDTSKGIKINNASVISADVECGNGVIHIIDTVLMPA